MSLGFCPFSWVNYKTFITIFVCIKPKLHFLFRRPPVMWLHRIHPPCFLLYITCGLCTSHWLLPGLLILHTSGQLSQTTASAPREAFPGHHIMCGGTVMERECPYLVTWLPVNLIPAPVWDSLTHLDHGALDSVQEFNSRNTRALMLPRSQWVGPVWNEASALVFLLGHL